MTVVQKIINWLAENNFSETDQYGAAYIAIDYEIMRAQFAGWLEAEVWQNTLCAIYETQGELHSIYRTLEGAQARLEELQKFDKREYYIEEIEIQG